METEIWKDIPNHEGLYQVSNFGRVKSMDRVVANNGGKMFIKGIFIKPQLDKDGYQTFTISKENKPKAVKVHQLVAILFLGHVPCGMDLVVNHKDLDKSNNHFLNLEIVNQRSNSVHYHKSRTGTSSKYIGVHWSKHLGKWESCIYVNKKLKRLGSFDIEIDASLAYQKALSII